MVSIGPWLLYAYGALCITDNKKTALNSISVNQWKKYLQLFDRTFNGNSKCTVNDATGTITICNTIVVNGSE